MNQLWGCHQQRDYSDKQTWLIFHSQVCLPKGECGELTRFLPVKCVDFCDDPEVLCSPFWVESSESSENSHGSHLQYLLLLIVYSWFNTKLLYPSLLIQLQFSSRLIETPALVAFKTLNAPRPVIPHPGWWSLQHEGAPGIVLFKHVGRFSWDPKREPMETM